MGTYETTVTGSFAARHAVRTPAGDLEEPHEHTWRVTAAFRADRLDDDGFVVDFIAARDALGRITGELAGSDLNESVAGSAPAGASAERVAEYIAAAIAAEGPARLHCVRVTEAPGCEAAYYPD